MVLRTISGRSKSEFYAGPLIGWDGGLNQHETEYSYLTYWDYMWLRDHLWLSETTCDLDTTCDLETTCDLVRPPVT